MRTVPLYGAKAAGRVALVDDGDYGLVAPYSWCIIQKTRSGRVIWGPYATAYLRCGGLASSIRMHKLITGWAKTDHKDHDGLNNQRGNLRPAGELNQLNLRNVRARTGCTSAFKGVSQRGNRWRAYIGGGGNGVQRHLGMFGSDAGESGGAVAACA